MTDPAVTAALISAIVVLAVALVGVMRNNKNNKKKNNPGSLHDVLMLLTEMNGKLDRLKEVENKLDKLLRG